MSRKYVMQSARFGEQWITCSASFGQNADRPGPTSRETTDINEAFICLSYWTTYHSPSSFRIIDQGAQQ